MSFDQYWVLVLLALARSITFIYFLPFLKISGFPTMAKASIAIGISLFVAYRMEPIGVDSLWTFLAMMLLEIIVGLILAYVVELMVSIVRIAGSIVDIDVGFSNPFMDINHTQTTVFSSLFYLMFVLVFLVTGGFNDVFAGFIYSFGLDISKQFLLGGNLLDFLLKTFTYMFFGALQIALPFMMATFLVNLALLLMSKSVDKINILANVFGIKILVGIMLVFVAIPTITVVFQQVNDNLIEKFFDAMNYMFVRKS
ncbi:flagellar biosynthetic protein FliR [Priestia sp. SB1]|uniref:flagellar biosynthetic protein FliR n=1 Tax=Priestia sp. SB1 TaxID=3132359 RepID=UPI0031813D4B